MARIHPGGVTVAVDVTKLIAAPMLQDYLVDKDTGTPLAAGIITCYKDQARTEFKNWFQQTGDPSSGYTYVVLPNPLVLSSVGTIQDSAGNDVIPFFYPLSEASENVKELYYITVFSAIAGIPAILQFTREGFPGGASSSAGSSSGFTDLISNGEFWRHSSLLDCTNFFNKIICPSQHDNYNLLNDNQGISLDLGNSDIRFLKDKVGANDMVDYPIIGTEAFPSIVIPEVSLRIYSSVATTGEIQKSIQIPASMRIRTLSNVTATMVFYAKRASAIASASIELFIYQYTGAGAITQPAQIPMGNTSTNTYVLSDAFVRYTNTFTFPAPPDDFLDTGTGSDAFFIRFQLPRNAVYDVNIAQPQLYIGDTVPDILFRTYDRIETVINSPRTGDIHMSMNSFYNWGYVPMDNGTIGSPDSNASTYANQNAYALYSLMWYAMRYSQSYAPMFESTGETVQYGSTGNNPQTDWIADRQISLLRAFGQVLAGTAPTISASQIYTTDFGGGAGIESILTITAASANSVQYADGTPVVVYNSGGGSALSAPLVATQTYFTFYVSQVAGVAKLKLSLEPIPESYTRYPNCVAASVADQVGAVYADGADADNPGVGATLEAAAIGLPITVDTVTPVLGDYVLLKNQATTLQNGIYSVTVIGDATTKWQLTRAVFADEPQEITPFQYTLITGGAVNISTEFASTGYPGKIGTDAIAFGNPTFSTNFIIFTNDGTASQHIQRQIYNVGQTIGERGHILTTAELPTTLSSTAATATSAAAGGNTYFGPGGGGSSNLVNTIGDNPHNTMQPTTYMNVFMKL